ncbi:hypothetical protein [Ruegeria sp.]|uniref:hypothetical protein n=1 Tax=Ruegeria sp. TaxID=1879320 RepID=UPI003C7C7D4A
MLNKTTKLSMQTEARDTAPAASKFNPPDHSKPLSAYFNVGRIGGGAGTPASINP